MLYIFDASKYLFDKKMVIWGGHSVLTIVMLNTLCTTLLLFFFLLACSFSVVNIYSLIRVENSVDPDLT